MKKADRKMCAETIDDFTVEICRTLRWTTAPSPLGSVADFISPSLSKEEVISRIVAPRENVNSFFVKLQNDIRNAGAAGNWRRVAFLTMMHTQFASSLGFDFVIDAKKRTERRLAANRSTRRRHERVRLDDRNANILREWRAYSGHSVHAFWLWMKRSRYSQLRDKERTDRNLKFAKQLKPRGTFLRYDVFRTLITPKMRAHKKTTINS
jgi:hypothetical protein